MAGIAVGELRIAVEAGAGRISPGADARLPGGDDPLVAGWVLARDIGLLDDFVDCRLLLKTAERFEHDAVLDEEPLERLAGAVALQLKRETFSQPDVAGASG